MHAGKLAVPVGAGGGSGKGQEEWEARCDALNIHVWKLVLVCENERLLCMALQWKKVPEFHAFE